MKPVIYGGIVAAVILVASWSLAAACKNNRECSSKDVGVVIDANVIPTAFNESIKTQVKTEDAFVVIWGAPFVPIGASATIEECACVKWYCSGMVTRRLCFDSTCHRAK